MDLRLGNATQVGRCGTAGTAGRRSSVAASVHHCCLRPTTSKPALNSGSSCDPVGLLNRQLAITLPCPPLPHQIHYTWGPKLKSRSNDSIMWAFEKRLWRDQRFVDEVGHILSTSHGACSSAS